LHELIDNIDERKIEFASSLRSSQRQRIIGEGGESGIAANCKPVNRINYDNFAAIPLSL